MKTKFRSLADFNENLWTAQKIAAERCQSETMAEAYKNMRAFVNVNVRKMIPVTLAKLSLQELNHVLRNHLQITDITLENVKEYVQEFANEKYDSVANLYLNYLADNYKKLTVETLRSLISVYYY